LADALTEFEELAPSADAGALAVRWAFEAVAHAAAALGHRAILMLDGVENAFWNEGGGTLSLAAVVEPLVDAPSALRRIWAGRTAPRGAHPLLPPVPATGDQWEVHPLPFEAAAEYAARLAREVRLDYDNHLLNDYLSLWGGIPRWLANFVRKAAESPRSLTMADQLLQFYMEDVLAGATAQRLGRALNPPVGSFFEPAAIARVAEKCLAQEGGAQRPALVGSASFAAGDRPVLERLARAELAVYDGQEWRAPDVPVLADFLALYVACHFHRQSRMRSEMAIKRRRLAETPQRARERDFAASCRRISLLMHTFRGQNVPGPLLAAHRADAGVQTGTAVADQVPSHQAATLAARRAAPVSSLARIRIPYCISTFVVEPDRGAGADRTAAQRQSPTGSARAIPAVVGWCFEEPGYYRSEESIWIAYVCDAKVITTDELSQIERTTSRLSRELNVQQTVSWLITDARFSPQALGRLADLVLYTSTWPAFEALGEILLDTSRESGSTDADEHRAAPTRTHPEGDADRASQRPSGMRIAGAGSEGNGASVVELRLPPRENMELIAARTTEHIAETCGFSAEAAGQIRMATLEACLNAIEHSVNEEKEVRVLIEGTPEKISIVVENEGLVFDPQSIEDPRIEEKIHGSSKRGWGVKLIEKFMDRVVFEPYDRGTRMRMEKRNPSPARVRPAASRT